MHLPRCPLVSPFFEKRGINDRANITLGFLWADMETTAQINSELGLGTTLFLERLFEAPRSLSECRIRKAGTARRTNSRLSNRE